MIARILSFLTTVVLTSSLASPAHAWLYNVKTSPKRILSSHADVSSDGTMWAAYYTENNVAFTISNLDNPQMQQLKAAFDSAFQSGKRFTYGSSGRNSRTTFWYDANGGQGTITCYDIVAGDSVYINFVN